ncbi:hypothetical protein JD508_08105 [Aeromonas jandaei]|uniref:hypothetical protein n=2 Tax=Aeromonas jandaei TaxID=650 RepID=UPI00191DE506|nr:hypothetical protein [Aeromonas jandaei]MBL0610223.1 hypothetical protein [Aeromonas jandaei]
MQHEIGRLFGIFYIGTYLAAILLGMGCYIWRDEMIFLLGFGFFGCFMAARLAMGSVFSALSISSAWLIGFISTTLINCLLLGVITLMVYLTHQCVSVELADNASWLLLAFQGFSALFILGGLKCCHTRLVTS